LSIILDNLLNFLHFLHSDLNPSFAALRLSKQQKGSEFLQLQQTLFIKSDQEQS
jgi:hypothetical protein